MSESGAVAVEHVDAVVIGGGVIGLSTAYELLRSDPSRFARTLVLERGEVGCGATQASAGMIAPMSEAEVQSLAVVELGLDSLHRYADFIGGIEQLTGLSCGYRREGTVWGAADGDELGELEHVKAILADKGVGARLLTANELLALEPHLSSRVAGGLQVALDHHVDARRFTLGLAAAVRKLGGQVREGHAVRRIERGADGWVVSGEGAEGDRWRVVCRSVVLAAGAWSESEIEGPLPRFGLRPVKGQAVRLQQPAAPLLRHVLRSPRVYLVPAEDGSLVIGATAEEQGFDDSPTAGATMDLLRYAWRLLPGIYDLPLSELVVGFRPALRDHQPAIGGFAEPELDQLFVAIGHYRDGILLAPATAHYMAQLMREGEVPEALAPFSPARL